MQLHYRSADIELLLLDIMIWRDDEVSLVEEDSSENLDKFTRWTRSQKSERFDRKGIISIFVVEKTTQRRKFYHRMISQREII